MTKTAGYPLVVENATVRYGSRDALAGISFQVQRGEILGIAGPNGSGKTTLLRALFGAQQLTRGRITIDGRALTEMRPAQISRRLSVVSQFESETDRMRVWELVLLGRSPHRKDTQGFSSQDHQIAAAALADVGLAEAKERYLDTLSGGERQRALIARSLAQQCDCMLLDEPTNHLDVKYQHQILRLIRKVAGTAVVVLHDLNLVARYCDQAIILKEGRLYSQGRPGEILDPKLIREVYGVDAITIADRGSTQFVFHADN